jgi:hypothetical protein
MIMKKILLIIALSISTFCLFAQTETKLHASQIQQSGATADQFLKWDNSAQKWVAANPPAGADNWGSQVVVSDVTLSGDGTSGTPLSVVGTLTDDQTIDEFSLSSNTLSLSLESDGEAAKTVSLAAYLDNMDAQDLTLTGNTLAISNDPNTDVDLSGYLDNTDSQDLSLSSNTLSLTGDGTSVDLSGYLDNTDTQDLGYTATTGALTLTNGGSVNILVSAQYTEEVFSSLTSGNTVTISGTFPSTLDGVVVTRGGLLQRIGASFDYTISGQIVTFEARNFENGETVIIKYPN